MLVRGREATTREPIAWHALAAIDPNGDQVFAGYDLLKPPHDKGQLHCASPQELWAELEKAVGSPGDLGTAGKGWTPLVGQAVSYSYYWIHNICALGVRDAAVSADYPKTALPDPCRRILRIAKNG